MARYPRTPASRQAGDAISGLDLDTLVDLAHTEPGRAEKMLARAPFLAIEPSSWGETCLEAASHLGHRRLLGRLTDAGVPADLFAECALGEPDSAVAALRSGGCELLGVHDLPVLHFAVMSRDRQTVDTLLEAGARVNSAHASFSPLHSAVACGELAIAERLLEAGADPLAPDAFGCSAIDWAIYVHGEACMLARVLAGRVRLQRRR